MVITVLKATFTKSKPNVITYRDFKLFNEEKLKTDLTNSLRIANISSYHAFEKMFLKVLGGKGGGGMLRLKTKQSELIMHHISQKL